MATYRESVSYWGANGTRVLARGDVGVEDETGQVKVGNGVTPWSGLEYFGGASAPWGDTPVFSGSPSIGMPAAPTVVSAGVRSNLPNNVLNAAWGVHTMRVAEKTNAAVSEPWVELWNGRVNAGLTTAAQEVANICPLHARVSLVTNISGTALNQSGATLTGLTFFGCAYGSGYCWDLAGTGRTAAEFTAAGGAVSADGREVSIPPGWYVRSDPARGLSLAAGERYFIQEQLRVRPSAGVASLTSVGTTATMTTSAAHGRSTGDYVYVANASVGAYNGVFQITVTSATQFTYTFAGGASPATGAALQDARPYYTIQRASLGDANWQNSNTVGYADTLDWTAASSTADGGNIATAVRAVFGSNTAGKRMVAIHGDSIVHESRDYSVDAPAGGYPLGDADGALCYAARALNAAGYSFVKVSMGGTTALNPLTYGGYGIRAVLSRFAAAHLTEMGRNDVFADLAAYQAIFRRWWSFLRTLGQSPRIVQTTYTPTSGAGSSANWSTRAGQTTAGVWVHPTGAVYAGVHPFLTGSSLARGVDPDAVLDVAAIVGAIDGGGVTGAWPADGTAYRYTVDGVHPSGSGHAAIAARISVPTLADALGFSP